MSVNKVILLGNVGQAPEIRDGQSGKFATFNLATTDKGFTRQDGTQVPERTEWHSCVVFGRQAETVEKYVGKGMRLYVEGKLRTRKYTARDNTEKYVTEIIVDNFEMLSKKEASNPAVPFENQMRFQQNPQNWSGNDNTTFEDVPF